MQIVSERKIVQQNDELWWRITIEFIVKQADWNLNSPLDDALNLLVRWLENSLPLRFFISTCNKRPFIHASCHAGRRGHRSGWTKEKKNELLLYVITLWLSLSLIPLSTRSRSIWSLRLNHNICREVTYNMIYISARFECCFIRHIFSAGFLFSENTQSCLSPFSVTQSTNE